MPGIANSKCVLVTGATAGIGRSLALAIAKMSNDPCVIAAGRRQDRLDELSEAGLETIQVDLDTDRDTLKQFIDNILEKYPDLDTVVLSAGIQHEFYFQKPNGVDLTRLTSELNLNYTSIVTTITYLLPHFLKLGASGRPCFIVPVTSGLGIVPLPWLSNYAALKAALHSFSISLNAQLQGTNVHILELIPPLVESEIHDAAGTTEKLSKFWMPLDEFTREALEGLKNGDRYIAIGTAKRSFRRFEQGKDEVVEMIMRSRAE